MTEIYIMKPETLLIAFHKTKRAKAKIDNLDHLIASFLDSSPYKMVSHLNEQGTEEVWHYEFSKAIPLDFPVLIGEILHNLRSPLDQLCCAIAYQTRHSENGVCFPCGRDENSFKSALREQKKLPVEARYIISTAQPYRRGNGHLLWVLNELNRRDKHRIGLVMSLLHTTVVRSVKCYGAPLIRVGSRHGLHMMYADAGRLIQDDPARRPFFREIGGVKYIEFGPLTEKPIYDDMEIATTAPGARLDINAKPTFTISFSQVGVDGQPITAVLHDMRDLVERLLLAFEKRFFS
jgi:hypothetical protein